MTDHLNSKATNARVYITTYTPSLLASLPRNDQRQSIGIAEGDLPFKGVDVWNAYEFSWLNTKGKPEVVVVQLQVPCVSSHLIESKSLKQYLGSFSQTSFKSSGDVISTIESDLAVTARSPVSVNMLTPDHVQHGGLGVFPGQNLDLLDIDINDYSWSPTHLATTSDTIVRESFYTNLFQSLCPLTGQPDFASISIEKSGASIDQEGLLRYLVSYREHAEFAEQVIERIFVDIVNQCSPARLTVSGKFNRRGGIDINPYRSHDDGLPPELRLWRQ